MCRGRTREWVRRAPSRLMSISSPSRPAGVYRIRAPTPAPSSITTVPGPDGPATGSLMSGRVAEAAVRNPEVGELADRRVADAGRGQPVGELACRRVRLERLVDQRVGHAGQRPQFDRDHVVGYPAAVREAAGIAAEQPEDALLARGSRRDGGVQRSEER